MLHRYGKVAALAVLVVLAGTTLAQQRQFPLGGFGGGAGFLLTNPDVQQELKLSEEQITKTKDAMQTVRATFKDKFAALKDTPQEDRPAKMQEIAKEMNTETEKSLKGILNADQQKRLKQLELQQRGADALTDAEVEKTLNLTAEQKDKIKTIREDSGKEMREIFQNAAGNFQEAMTKIQTLRKETTEKATSVLTDVQKKSWKEMTGAPFEFKLRRPGA
jgi:Spy/CpxP family protein refolding chaperone